MIAKILTILFYTLNIQAYKINEIFNNTDYPATIRKTNNKEIIETIEPKASKKNIIINDNIKEVTLFYGKPFTVKNTFTYEPYFKDFLKVSEGWQYPQPITKSYKSITILDDNLSFENYEN